MFTVGSGMCVCSTCPQFRNTTCGLYPSVPEFNNAFFCSVKRSLVCEIYSWFPERRTTIQTGRNIFTHSSKFIHGVFLCLIYSRCRTSCTPVTDFSNISKTTCFSLIPNSSRYYFVELCLHVRLLIRRRMCRLHFNDKTEPLRCYDSDKSRETEHSKHTGTCSSLSFKQIVVVF
jgi:hypothetical protein